MMPVFPRRLLPLAVFLSLLGGCSTLMETSPDVAGFSNANSAIAAIMPVQSARAILAREGSFNPAGCSGMLAPANCAADLNRARSNRCDISQTGVSLAGLPSAGSLGQHVPLERLNYTTLDWWANSNYRVVKVVIGGKDANGRLLQPCPVSMSYSSLTVSNAEHAKARAHAGRLATALEALGMSASFDPEVLRLAGPSAR